MLGTRGAGSKGEWLSPEMLPDKKLMGSMRLQRAVAIMGGWKGLVDRSKGDLAVETLARSDSTLDTRGVQILQSELAKLVLAESEEEDAAGDRASEEDAWRVLICEWTEAIAEAYGTPAPIGSHVAPSNLTPVVTPSSEPFTLSNNTHPTAMLSFKEFPEAEKLREWVREKSELNHLTDYDLYRFLVLRKGDASKTLATLLAHWNWLDSPGYGVARVGDVTARTPGMQNQIRSGKCFLLNKRDVLGRPVVMIYADKHDPAASR